MTRSAPINVFQKLMRRWDADHPYNAGQFLRLTGRPVDGDWCRGWRQALGVTGLGELRTGDHHYQFTVPESDGKCPVNFVTAEFDQIVSTELNQPFREPGLPFRPLVIVGENEFHVGVIYQHWLADSTAIRMLMREWFTAVCDPAAVRQFPLRLPRTGYWKTLKTDSAPGGVVGSVLDLTRRHTRLRKVMKIGSTALDDRQTAYRAIETRPGLIADLRAAARAGGVKVNDVLLTALTATCAAHVPLQRRPKRTDVAVGSVVDLRPFCRGDLSETFGLYLGFTNVVCRERELSSFNAMLHSVSVQTRHQKRAGVASASLMWMSAALVVGTLSKPGDLYHFYRKEMPLAGGVSNVDLTRDWPAKYFPSPVTDYVRVSPTGPMTPLVLTATTLGERFNLGMTYRTGLISSDLAAAIAGTFVGYLERFAGQRQTAGRSVLDTPSKKPNLGP
jgi:hypothetical protein